MFHRVTSAHVLALIALFVALGGASYAAVSLPAKSVGTKQLRNGAVTAHKIAKNAVRSSQVKDGSLVARDFKPGQLRAGPPGPPGATGTTGAQGPPGRSALTPLQAGESESGVFAVGGPSRQNGDSFLSAVTFPIPLSHSLDGTHVIAVDGKASVDHCPGAGQADPGFLCLYVGGRSVELFPLHSTNINNPADTPNAGADKRGFVITAAANTTTSFAGAVGTWTYTQG